MKDLLKRGLDNNVIYILEDLPETVWNMIVSYGITKLYIPSTKHIPWTNPAKKIPEEITCYGIPMERRNELNYDSDIYKYYTDELHGYIPTGFHTFIIGVNEKNNHVVLGALK